MKTDNSTNIHVFRVNRAATVAKIRDTPTQANSIKVNSRTSLSAETKRLICEDHINNPKCTQEALASKYGCKRTTVAKIIKSRNRWLAIDSDAAIAKRFRQRSSRYPHVENALLLWVQKEFSDITLVTDQMLRSQARQYAQAFHVEGLEDFKASSSWVSNFKQRYITPKSRDTISPPPSLLLKSDINAIPTPSPSDIQISKNNVNHDIQPSVVEFNTPPFNPQTHKLTTSLPNNTPVETFNLNHTQVTSWNLPPTGPNQNSDDIINPNSSQNNITRNCGRDEISSPNQIMEPESNCNELVDNEDDMMLDAYEDMSSPCYDDQEMNGPKLSPIPDTHQELPRQDNSQLVEPTIETLSPTIKHTIPQENSKLSAKQHLEAALAFYTSQNGPSQSMSANMIKLILENDF